MAERFMRVKEIAEQLGIKPRTIIEYRYKKRLDLPLEKKCGMLGCRESVFNNWLSERGGK